MTKEAQTKLKDNAKLISDQKVFARGLTKKAQDEATSSLTKSLEGARASHTENMNQIRAKYATVRKTERSAISRDA